MNLKDHDKGSSRRVACLMPCAPWYPMATRRSLPAWWTPRVSKFALCVYSLLKLAPIGDQRD